MRLKKNKEDPQKIGLKMPNFVFMGHVLPHSSFRKNTLITSATVHPKRPLIMKMIICFLIGAATALLLIYALNL